MMSRLAILSRSRWVPTQPESDASPDPAPVDEETAWRMLLTKQEEKSSDEYRLAGVKVGIALNNLHMANYAREQIAKNRQYFSLNEAKELIDKIQGRTTSKFTYSYIDDQIKQARQRDSEM